MGALRCPHRSPTLLLPPPTRPSQASGVGASAAGEGEGEGEGAGAIVPVRSASLPLAAVATDAGDTTVATVAAGDLQEGGRPTEGAIQLTATTAANWCRALGMRQAVQGWAWEAYKSYGIKMRPQGGACACSGCAASGGRPGDSFVLAVPHAGWPVVWRACRVHECATLEGHELRDALGVLEGALGSAGCDLLDANLNAHNTLLAMVGAWSRVVSLWSACAGRGCRFCRGVVIVVNVVKSSLHQPESGWATSPAQPTPHAARCEPWLTTMTTMTTPQPAQQ